jgi:hypothetical protein
MVTWGNWWWPAFLIGTFLAFIIPELFALFTQTSTHTDNTLSGWTWQTEPPTYSWEWFLSLILWLAVAIWLTGHIWWAIWRG